MHGATMKYIHTHTHTHTHIFMYNTLNLRNVTEVLGKTGI